MSGPIVHYVGRFAPSPSGPLHLGSLLAATASFLHAKQHGGLWRLRMDDLDTPRNQPGAADDILCCLEAHGLTWDGDVIYQSQRIPVYQAALAQLASQQRLFYCNCSRKVLVTGQPYPGTCHHRRLAPNPLDHAVRVQCHQDQVGFNDLVSGPQQVQISQTSGDYIVWRRDGQPSYQLATAVDDGLCDITHVVRGNDLLADTARQLHLVQLLGGHSAHYAHIPVAVDQQGIKLSKRTGAKPVLATQAPTNLHKALTLLGLDLPHELQRAAVAEQLVWAVDRWRLPQSPQTQQ